jgi:hypothetical protein
MHWELNELCLTLCCVSDGLIRVVGLQPNKIIGISIIIVPPLIIYWHMNNCVFSSTYLPKGVIGDHEDFPVEGIRRNKDNFLLGSFSHDEVVRFWDITMFAEDIGDNEDNAEYVEDDESAMQLAGDVAADRGSRRSKAGKKKMKGGSAHGDIHLDIEQPVASSALAYAGSDDEGDEEEAWIDEEDSGSGEETSKSGAMEGVSTGGGSDNDDDDDDSSSEQDVRGGPQKRIVPTKAQKFFSDL